ncbi:MAG: nitrilase-related carbon-nitrogen hydrolase [Oscillospiraceae bacterium]
MSLPRWASTSTTPPAITSRPFRSTGTNAACSSATTSASPSFSARWRFRASSCCSCPRSGSPRGGIDWETLTAARAIENQFFLAACNSCGTAGETVFGGASRILGPRGELLAAAGASEEIVTAALDFSVLAEVRNSINVFHDRRPELYRL